MRKYQPSNRVPLNGLMLLIMVALISSFVLGLILSALDLQNIHLVVVFPLLAGAIAGGAFVLAVRVGKVRNPRVAALVALITAVLLFGVYQDANYTSGQEKIGASDFVGYLTKAAKVGFPFTRSGIEDADPDVPRISGDAVYLYWLVEILLTAGLAAWLAAREARQPFDESAECWYAKPLLVAVGPTFAEKLLIDALWLGDFQRAAQLLTTAPLRYSRTELWMRRSPAPSEPAPDVYLNVRYGQRRNRVYSRASGMITAVELDRLLRAIPPTTP